MFNKDYERLLYKNINEKSLGDRPIVLLIFSDVQALTVRRAVVGSLIVP